MALVIFSASCLNRISTADYYEKLKSGYSKIKPPSESKTLATSGGISITDGDFFYSAENERVLTSEDLKKFNRNTAKIIIEKAMIRRLTVRDGLAEHIYEDQKAAEYILPRVEKILEEYYYENAYNKTSEEKYKAILFDTPLINAYAAKKSEHSHQNFGKDSMEAFVKKIQSGMREVNKKKTMQSVIEKYYPIKINFEEL